MTRALLDTHALVWAATAPDRLGPVARALIEDPSTDLVVSAASAWELSTKVRLGRFPEARALVARYHSIVASLRAEHLAVEPDHALRGGSLAWDHRDPFDRMLVAQAIVEGAILLSKDRAFGAVAGLDVRW